MSKAIGIPVEIYDGTDTTFIATLRNLKEHVLIVGRANTVDDLVNGLVGKPLIKELPDIQFGDLFIGRKNGNTVHYEVGCFDHDGICHFNIRGGH